MVAMSPIKSVMIGAVAAAMVAISACNGAPSSASDTTASPAGLAIVPLTITQGARTHRFRVEVARTSREQAQGLMFRSALAADAGMVFPFDPPRFASFWMKDTLIPLDMIFVRADGSIDRIAENTVPQSLEPVGSGGEVAAVLELAGGSAARLGIDETAIVRWRGDRGPQASQP